MLVRTLIPALLGCAVLALAVPAHAADICKEHPKAEWMKPAAIESKAKELGYEVRSVGEEDGCWEVKGTKAGKRIEVYFDPVTAEVVKTKGG